MFKQVMFSSIVLVVTLTCQAQADQINSTWTLINENGLWSDANNWSPQIVPDNNDTTTFAVTIDSTSGVWTEVEFEEREFEKTYTIQTMDCNGDVELEGLVWFWTHLTLDNLNNYDFLTIDGLDIHGNITNNADAEIHFEENGQEVGGNLNNLAGGSIVIEGSLSIDNNLVNSGWIGLVNPGVVVSVDGQVSNNGEISLYGSKYEVSSVFDNNSNGVVEGFGGIESDQRIQNKGEIYSTGGMLVLRSYLSVVNSGTLSNRPLFEVYIEASEDVNNSGIIEVNPGGGVASNCNLVNKTDATISLLGGTLAAPVITQEADANFAGFGIVAGNISIDPNGLIELTGPTNIVGDVDISSSASLEISDGTTLVTGHVTNNGIIHMKGGRLIPQGGITNNGNIIWEPGVYNNIADFNLDGQVNLKDFADFADTWLWQAGL